MASQSRLCSRPPSRSSLRVCLSPHPKQARAQRTYTAHIACRSLAGIPDFGLSSAIVATVATSTFATTCQASIRAGAKVRLQSSGLAAFCVHGLGTLSTAKNALPPPPRRRLVHVRTAACLALTELPVQGRACAMARVQGSESPNAAVSAEGLSGVGMGWAVGLRLGDNNAHRDGSLRGGKLQRRAGQCDRTEQQFSDRR